MKRFSINGIVVKAIPVGRRGYFLGIPESPFQALKQILSGSALKLPRVIMPLPDAPMPKTRNVCAHCGASLPEPHYIPPTPPVASRSRVETVAQYRQRTGLSRTKAARALGISRRTLGRWEQKGRTVRTEV